MKRDPWQPVGDALFAFVLAWDWLMCRLDERACEWANVTDEPGDD